MTDSNRSEPTVHSTAGGWIGHPEGLTLAEFDAHPIRQLIREAAYGGEPAVPSEAELDALKLPASARREVAKAARAAADEHATGRRSSAWAMGDQHAASIIDKLAPEQQRPDYLDEPPPADRGERDPRRLASRVGRTF